MPNAYTQLYVQIVFGVKYRRGLIQKEWKDSLYAYITGITQNQGHKMICINGVEDHIHIFIGLNPNQTISRIVQIIKSDSTNWINGNQLCSRKFSWQEGYGAFSYSRSSFNNVVRYIENQEEHHRKKTFKDEYVALLEKFNVEYDERYVFKELE